MRLFSGLLISTLALGTILATGCAEHRYQNGPYAGYGGYSGYYGYNDPYYRQWLAERRYNYIEYNRLNRERAAGILGIGDGRTKRVSAMIRASAKTSASRPTVVSPTIMTAMIE